jgi:hypothetical protein
MMARAPSRCIPRSSFGVLWENADQPHDKVPDEFAVSDWISGAVQYRHQSV